MEAKGRQLEALFKEMGGVLVAFSGGVDSSVLLAAAHKALGDFAVAVTGTSASVPAHDLESARTISSRLGVRWITLESGELEDQHYKGNPRNRCYFCKKSLFTRLVERASEENLPFVVDGSNTDDLTDIRPGMAAARELGVRSPFLELGIGKEMIRRLAKYYGLPNWDKPSSPCLASRIPYGELITPGRLGRIDRSESLLRDLGFRQLRVRDHGTLARVEIMREDMGRLLENGLREAVVAACKDAGYTFVTLDLQGYRTGAMHEVNKWAVSSKA
ncbi:MAG: ATP-dependent sacrificial sulfur transferase LarE [Syntrophobacteraceae bacterium]|jgi:uncharacterized protein